MNNLICSTRRAIESISVNEQIHKNQIAMVDDLLLELNTIKSEYLSSYSTASNHIPSKISEIREKITKLGEFYKYLKNGSIHSYIRTQLLRRIVNMNLNILSKVDMEKKLLFLKMKQKLIEIGK